MLRLETNLEHDLFTIEYDATRVGPSRFLHEIETLGFTGRLVSASDARESAPTDPKAPAAQSALVAKLLARAAKEQKPLVLEFSGKWCGACRRLEQETLADPRVKAALGDVIFQKIMVEEDRAAAALYDVRAIPQLRFLAPDGSLQAQDQGVVPVERMLAHLAAVKESAAR